MKNLILMFILGVIVTISIAAASSKKATICKEVHKDDVVSQIELYTNQYDYEFVSSMMVGENTVLIIMKR